MPLNLFNKKKKAPNLGQSINQLRDSINALDKRESYLQKQAQLALENAKMKSKKGDKRGALYELKRKKMFEHQMEGMYGKRVNLETQIMALQNTVTNKEVMDAMKQSRDAFSAHVSDKIVEEVSEIVDDIEENLGLLNEMDEALSQPVHNIFDETNLDEELEQLEHLAQVEEEESTIEIPSVEPRKSAEKTKVERQNEFDAELEQLEKSLLAL
jgi:charged multivesicular body protein 4